MKIIVFSDSHSGLSFMRRCVDRTKPDAIIHLGDYVEDAMAIAEDYPHIPMHMVAGNCDRYRCPPSVREMLCYDIGGVRMMLTHGHIYAVKSGIGGLLAEGRRLQADVILFGHTHKACCSHEPDGMWVLNPGTCGFYGGSFGLIETKENKITACRCVSGAELEEIL